MPKPPALRRLAPARWAQTPLKRLGRGRRQGAPARKWRERPGRDAWREFAASFARSGLLPAPGPSSGEAAPAARSLAAVEATEGAAVLLLPHGQALTFTGKCRLTCLRGAVQVFGFTIAQEQPPYDLFSPQTHCALTIEAVTYEAAEKSKKELRISARAVLRAHRVPRGTHGPSDAYWSLLCRGVKSLPLTHARIKLLKSVAPLCSLVLMEGLDTSVTRFILNHPEFSHIFRMKRQKSPCFAPEDAALAATGIGKRDPESGLLLSESSVLATEELIQACCEEDDGCPVILVCGPKSIGKSTFNRYLINLLLNNLPCVEYMECDLGQTEFTPPGCVSLINVSEPCLGPPFTHQRMPHKMVYYGEASCDQDTERYIDTVKYVFNSYKKEVPLIINTMGWVKGVGLLLLTDIIRLLAPSHIVQISVEDFKDMPHFTPEYVNLAAGLHTKGRLQGKCKSMDVSGMEDWKQYEGESDLYTSTPGHKLLCVQPEFPGAGNAGEARVHSGILRDVAILGYLGQLQPLETRSVLPLHSLIPYQVPFNSVALRVIHTDVVPTHIMYSVNASWVGLCRILDEVRCQTDGPILLTQTPVCDCLGFGIIRGVDMERKLYHILTPVPPENLRLVNCLLLGNIAIPDCVFTNQGTEGEIPYVTSEYNYDILGAGKLKMKKHLKRREHSRS
ncbi:polynucleotide 5'-hydroxyl-kinase NOL9 isoform X2 [Carettochelys insculpta]|uniref:polynucleotide 5'-hydroxyl-kinase NOL9 isoform X2 n=1 Tax=Carettochelys insculpta TaxID=44489 RepID=UPI003EBDC1D4